MTVEFQVGSLANLISGNNLVSSSKKKKIFGTIPSEKGIVKFKSVKKFKKSKRKDDELKSTSSDNAKPETSSLDNAYEMMKPSSKIKSRKRTNFNEHSENEIKRKPSNTLSAIKRLKYKKKQETQTNNESKKEYEVFVGNVPHNITKKKLTKLFRQYGKVETVRLRCAPLSDPRIPKKVAVIKKNFHPDRNSMHAFVRFTKVESAKQAVQANGMCFENHHIRVDLVSGESRHDMNKAVFLGNVPFAAEEEDLWKIFEPCGTISSIRIVRDKYTGVGKGFAYINFEDADAVELALNLDGTNLNKRNLRVKRCIKKAQKIVEKKEKSGKDKKQKHMKRKHKELHEEINSDEPKIKKMKMLVEDQNSEQNEEYISKKKKKEKVNKKMLKSKINAENEDDAMHTFDSEKSKKSFTFKTSFQGQKTAEDKKLRKKKKGKVNKGEFKKRNLIEKISSKSKPSMKSVKKPTLKFKSAAKKMKLKPSSV